MSTYPTSIFGVPLLEDIRQPSLYRTIIKTYLPFFDIHIGKNIYEYFPGILFIIPY